MFDIELGIYRTNDSTWMLVFGMKCMNRACDPNEPLVDKSPASCQIRTTTEYINGNMSACTAGSLQKRKKCEHSCCIFELRYRNV